MAGKTFPIKTGLAVLAVGAVGAVAYKALSLADTGSNVKMEFAGITPKGISNGKLNLGLSFRFLNPTKNDVKLDYILANVKLGNDLIGTITEANFNQLRQTNPNAFTLLAQNATTINITLSMGLVESVLSLIASFFGSAVTRQVKVEGFWKAMGFVRQSFDLNQDVKFA